MSAPSPAFQLYADDFMGGTAAMTAEEVGAYIRLLCYQWANGCIPSDPKRLALIAGTDVAQWLALWPALEPKFPGMVNPRMDLVRRERIAFLEKCREAGEKGREHGVKGREFGRFGGRPKKPPVAGVNNPPTNPGRNPPTNPPLQSPVSSLHTPTPTPEKPTPTPPVGRGRRKTPAEGWEVVFARGDYQRLRDDPRFGDAWGLWVKHCGESGARAVLPSGSQAAVLFNRALEWGGAKFAEAVENSIAHNWRGIDPAWLKNGHAQTPEKRMSIAERAALRFGVKD